MSKLLRLLWVYLWKHLGCFLIQFLVTEIRGSNPVIGKFYILSTVSKQCKKTKMKKKNGNGPFYKFYLQDNELDTRETKRRWTDIFWKRHCCWSQHCLEIASTQKLQFQNIFNYCCSWERRLYTNLTLIYSLKFPFYQTKKTSKRYHHGKE